MGRQVEDLVKPRVSVYIAASLDGFIARPNGGLDWLRAGEAARAGPGETEFAGVEDYGYQEFFDSVDVIVVGRKTFEKVLTFEQWPYDAKRVVVLSSGAVPIPCARRETVSTASGEPADLVRRLSAEGATHLYIPRGRSRVGSCRRRTRWGDRVTCPGGAGSRGWRRGRGIRQAYPAALQGIPGVRPRVAHGFGRSACQAQGPAPRRLPTMNSGIRRVPMITRVRFASIAVGDIDVSYDFYVNKLGFQPQVDTPLPDGNRFVMLVPPAGGSSIVISRPLPGQELRPVSSISFEADDVRKTYEDLSARGVEFRQPPAETPWGGVQAVFADPDGNTFMLQEGGFLEVPTEATGSVT